MEIEELPGKETWLCYFDPVEAALCNDKEDQHRSGFENLKKHLRPQHQD